MEYDRGSGRMLFCNQDCEALLAEELVYFLIPSFGHSWNYFYAIDLVQEPDQNPCSEVVDDGSSVGSRIKLHFNDFEFEFLYVLWEVVVIVDVGIGKPGSVVELVLWKVTWKSLMKSWKVLKDGASNACWVRTATQIFVVPSVMKERAHPTLLSSVE